MTTAQELYIAHAKDIKSTIRKIIEDRVDYTRLSTLQPGEEWFDFHLLSDARRYCNPFATPCEASALFEGFQRCLVEHAAGKGNPLHINHEYFAKYITLPKHATEAQANEYLDLATRHHLQCHFAPVTTTNGITRQTSYLCRVSFVLESINPTPLANQELVVPKGLQTGLDVATYTTSYALVDWLFRLFGLDA